VFTGYDTASHVAEETTNSHLSSPYAMIGAVLNAFVLGFVLILGMNFCIQDFDYIKNYSGSSEAYTIIWQSVVGTKATIFFLLITLVAIECRYVEHIDTISIPTQLMECHTIHTST
jgi:amino acid transporter